MINDNTFKILAIISPFIAAALAGFFSYYFNTKIKLKEYLYQNKIPAFKEIANELILLKKYCYGKIAQRQGNEFSPYYNESGTALGFRTSIANSSELNQIFLPKKSRESLNNLIGNLSFMCNLELQSSDPEKLDGEMFVVYEHTIKNIELCIETLYNDLKLN